MTTENSYQNRMMRTYEVNLADPETGDATGTERVNLSYELNEDLEPVANDGSVIEARSIAARIEVMKRLRKLAERGAAAVTTEAIDTTDWDIRLVRTAFVKVPLDENGTPIPHRTPGAAK